MHLYHAMASVQEGVSKACVSYYSRFRRSAHVTPKSFLNFIGSYKAVYAKQEDKIGIMSGRMNAGLDKLDEVAELNKLQFDIFSSDRPARQSSC